MSLKYWKNLKVHKKLDFIIPVYAPEELLILKLHS